MILQDSLNIDKTLTQHEIYLISYTCEHFQQNVLKIYPFSSSKLHKGVNIKIQISKLNIQSSAPQTISGSIDKILVPVACLRCLRSFQAAMKRLRHVDVTMTLISTGVVIRGLPGGGLPFLLPGLRKRVCRR